MANAPGNSGNNKGGHFGKGEYSYFICQRSGMKTKQSDGMFEPGTNLMIRKSESDGKYNAATHPLNFPPAFREEARRLKFPLSGFQEDPVLYILNEDGLCILLEGDDGGASYLNEGNEVDDGDG